MLYIQVLVVPWLSLFFSVEAFTAVSRPSRPYSWRLHLHEPYSLGLRPYKEPSTQHLAKDIIHLTKNASDTSVFANVTANTTTAAPSLTNVTSNETSKNETPLTIANATAIINQTKSSRKATQPGYNFWSKTAEIPKAPTSLSYLEQLGKQPTDLLTLKDLESILLTNRFVREADMTSSNNKKPISPVDGVGEPVSKAPTTKSVAFPQPSVLDYASLKWGTTAAASALGLLAGTSVAANLWLVGAIVGGLYGYEIGKNVAETAAPPSSTIASLLVRAGRRLATAYLKVYDALNTLFFMYKTGQLSYEYYKRYEVLDQRFAIQDKIDAWNERFAQGKIAFDRWERENEIGRKALAGLRTIWLVEQRSLKKARGPRKSRYRLVQFGYDVMYFVRRLVLSIYKALTGGGNADLREFLQGLRIEMSETRLNQVGERVRAVLAAIALVNLTGALFTISPLFLSILACVVGITWPSWAAEFVNRLGQFVDDTRSRGRGEVPRIRSSSDKSRYHYYVRDNGKKRYYRTGQPWFRRETDKGKQKKKWPWQTS